MRHNGSVATRPQAVSDEETVSPDQFNAHVTPDLTAAVTGYACFIRLNMCDYLDAFDRVRGYAWRRGGWGLSADHWDQVEHWIHDRLGLAIGREI